MNRTFRQLRFSIHGDEGKSLNTIVRVRRVYGMAEKRTGRTLWRKLKGAPIVIAVFAFLVVAAVLIRLAAFYPGFL
jgi:hypothetical protein